jgi:hypothetical protein
MNENPNRTKRYVLIFSGAIDAVLGAAIVLTGLGFFPIDLETVGIPPWIAWPVGGALFISGIWVAAHNYSRIDE